MDAETKIKDALSLIYSYGSIDGDNHKTWVLDQVVRILTGTSEDYQNWVDEHNTGDDGPNTYSWIPESRLS